MIKSSIYQFLIHKVDSMELLQKEHDVCSNKQTINNKFVDTRLRVRVKYIIWSIQLPIFVKKDKDIPVLLIINHASLIYYKG